jgi:hypothetical protein
MSRKGDCWDNAVSESFFATHRVIDLINVLSESLCREFAVSVTRAIKYQRAAKALGLWKDQ